MTAKITFYLHPLEANLEVQLLADYRSWHTHQQGFANLRDVLWLSPSQGACHELEQSFLCGCDKSVISPWFLTFDEFANKLLASSELNVFPLSPFEQRLLIREVVEQLQAQGKINSVTKLVSSNSFVSYLTRFITDMKRDEIWPETLRELQVKKGVGKKHSNFKANAAFGDLTTIYEAYQQELIASEHYDAQGRFWSARELLVNGHRGPFKQLKKIVVHGFQDFTASQKSILAYLATFLEELHISLPLEFPIRRNLLFAKVQSSLNSLRATFTSVEATISVHSFPQMKLAQQPETPQGLLQLRSSIFSVPTHFKATSDQQGIEILAVSGHQAEAHQIIARTKDLLQKGVQPKEIMIVFRQIDDDMQRFARLAEKAGLPVSCDLFQPLVETPVCQALSRLIHLQLDDWSYTAWANFLNTNIFFPESAASDPINLVLLRKLRELNLPGGQQEIELALNQHINREVSRLKAEDPNHWTHQLSLFLRQLKSILAPFLLKHTFAAWAELIIQTMNKLWKPVASHPFIQADKQHWDFIVGVLKDSILLERRLSHDDLVLSLPEMMVRLEVLLQTEIAANYPPTRTKGTIRILPAEEARHVSTDYLFLAGLTQDQYAAKARRNDWEELKSQVGNYQQKPLEDLLSEEQLLFYSICARTNKHITFTYAATNSAGEPLAPSPCIVSLLTLFNQTDKLIKHVGSLDPVENTDLQLNPAQQRLFAIKQLRKGEAGYLKFLETQLPTSEMALNQFATIETLHQRHYQHGLTNFEGELAKSAKITNFLQQSFPVHHQYSATQLEGYLSCPYRFMVQQLMSIRPISVPGLQSPQQRRGNIIHDVFASQHLIDHVELTSTFAETLKQFLKVRLGREVAWNEMQQALLEVEEHVLGSWCDEHLHNQEAYHQLMENFETAPQTKFVELSFGSAVPQDPSSPAQPDQPMLPPVTFGDDQQKVLLRGRIDRIDVGKMQGEEYYNIVDYKSGNVTGFNENLQNKNGYQLQLVMYAIAAVRLGIIPKLENVYQLGYWKVKGGGFSAGKSRAKANQPLGPQVMADFAAEIDRLIPLIVNALRAGHFPVFNRREDCSSHCNYKTICRINEVRAHTERLEKHFDVDPNYTLHNEEGESEE